LDAVSSRTDFLAYLPKDDFFLGLSFELELSSDSEEEATLSPELLLERYLLLLVFDRFVLLKSDDAGVLLVVPIRPRARWKKPDFFFSSTGGIIAEISSPTT
jgi:hypothetical protein